MIATRWRDWSITSKLSLLFAVSVFVGLVAFALVEDARERAEITERARERNLQRARATAQLLDFYLASVDANAQLVGVSPGTIEFLSDARHEQYRAEIAQALAFAREHGGYDAAFLTNPFGDVLIATDPQLVGRNYATAPWFRTAVAGRAAFDEPRYDPVERQVYLHVSAPVPSPRGAIVGTAVMRLTMQPIDSLLAADVNYDGRGAFGVLFDDNGIRLSHPYNPDLRYTPLAPLPRDVFSTMVFERRFGPATETLLSDTSRLDAVLERGRLLLFDDTTDPYIAFEGRAAGPVEAALVPLKQKRWVYAISSPAASLYAQVNARTLGAFAEAVALGLVALVVSSIGARWVTRPLRRVAETARALAAGDLSRRVGVTRRDEVGQLADAFDTMADAIASRDARLRNYAADLESQVQERTSQIQGLLENERAQRQLAESLREQTEKQMQRLTVLRNIDRTISASIDVQFTLRSLLDEITGQLRFDAADVLLVNPHTQLLTLAARRGFRSTPVQPTETHMGEGLAGSAAYERRVIYISNLREAEKQFAATPRLAGEGFVAYYAVPLVTKGKVKGVLEMFQRAPHSPDPDWLEFVESLGVQVAIAIENAEMFNDLQRSSLELTLAYDMTLEGWSRALDLRDKETEGHTQRVTELTLRLAQAMGLGEADLVHVRRGALLHDIGKMGVPDAILHKPGALTEEEWAIMRQHPLYAYNLLAPISHLRPALDIPYCHHEKWDGTGYPRGLKGEQIPLAARVFAVVDVWDALTSDRPYRKAWSEERARAYLCEQSGKHFDPKVVQVFLRNVLNSRGG